MYRLICAVVMVLALVSFGQSEAMNIKNSEFRVDSQTLEPLANHSLLFDLLDNTIQTALEEETVVETSVRAYRMETEKGPKYLILMNDGGSFYHLEILSPLPVKMSTPEITGFDSINP